MTGIELYLNNDELKSSDVPNVITQDLIDFTPRNKEESIMGLHLVARLDKAAKSIKEKSTNFLLNRCADCVNHLSADNTLEVKKVERHEKIYNDETLDNLLADKKQLDAKIKRRKAALVLLQEDGEKNIDGSDKVVEQLKSTYFKI